MSTGVRYSRNENSERTNWGPKRDDQDRDGSATVREWGWMDGDQTSNSDLALRQPYDHLVQTDKMATLGLMVGTVVHEVNNFLTGIMGAAQILEMSDSDAARQGYYKNILRMSQRIHGLLQGIKDFSHSPTQPYALTDVRLPVERAIALIENLLAPNGVRLIRAFRQDLPLIRGNADQLEQVFLNLFQNAVHAMTGGGVLTVSADLKGEEVVVAVDDTGCGISEEHLSRVFDVFFTTKPAGQGTGLGLTICRRIIREHRGQIGVESRMGLGAQFTVRLPAVQEGPVGAKSRGNGVANSV